MGCQKIVPGPFLLEMEQVHLAAETAMVAALGLLDLLDIGVQILLLGEGRGVDALEHGVIGIAAPIGARHLHQLEGVADFPGRGHVRAAAEVEPVALLVDRDFLVGGNGVDQFDFEGLAMGLEPGLGLIAGPFLAHDGFVGGDDLAHLLFDRREIVGRKRLGAIEIVIKTVFDHRADRHLRARIKRLHRVGQHMGGVVADQLERARIFAIEELDLGVGLDGVAISTIWPSSIMATVRLASEGEMLLAISTPETPDTN